MLTKKSEIHMENKKDNKHHFIDIMLKPELSIF